MSSQQPEIYPRLSLFASQVITIMDLGVSCAKSFANARDHIEKKITGGRLEYLVNNAGWNYTVPALEVDFEEVKQTFQTNIFGVIRLCQVLSPFLIAAKGCIVQIGSIAGIMPYVFGSAYNTSKAVLHAYSNTLRNELAPFGARVVIVVTGGVKSNIARVDRVLLSDSLYLPIAEEYSRRVKHSQEDSMETLDYARSVVRRVVTGNSRNRVRWVREGRMSWIGWFVDTFLPKLMMKLGK